jgi:hypothetical protein
MSKLLILIFFLSVNSYAQELPEHLKIMLAKSQDCFEIYNEKKPLEIEDGEYDESEFLLFSQIDQMQGLDVVFTRLEIKRAKLKMLEIINQSFGPEQLEAIIRVGRSADLNKKEAAIFFEVALEFKKGKLKDLKLPIRL